jgi:predicted ribosome quality control (RQC) complex YloA/Tae2 family protein
MDALTFLALIQDARRALVGARVHGVHGAGPHGLWIEFTTPAGQDSLLLSANETFPCLSRGAGRPGKAGPPSPLVGVARRMLPGADLQAVTHRGLERVAILEFAHPLPAAEAGCLLVAELFGRQPNLVLVGRKTGHVLEAARHLQGSAGRTIAPEHPYLPPPTPARPDPRILGSVQAIRDALAPMLAAGLAPPVALRQGLAGLSRLWEQEVVVRTGNGDPEKLAGTILDLVRAVESGPWEPRLLLDSKGRPIGLSPIRLRHIPEEDQQPCRSLGEMVERLASHLSHQRTLTTRQTALRQVLRRLENRLESRRAKLVVESLEFGRADLLRRMGEILVAHQGEVPRGATEVTLPDLAAGAAGGVTAGVASGSGASVTIPLDPALPPAANAGRFFKAARRGRRGAIRVAARLAETEAELGRVRVWIERVAEAPALEVLDAIHEELQQTPRLLAPRDRASLDGSPTARRAEPGRVPTRRPSGEARGGRSRQQEEAGLEPRRFVSSDGLPILVGRNTEGNDYLTLRLAKSHDLWLHVQGHGGSHVVVRANRSGSVPRRTLIQAAQLAAYYSQARNHGKVAVDYTLRKYVHKPRKAKPGLVIISQEKTIIVSPDKALIQKLAAPDG